MAVPHYRVVGVRADKSVLTFWQGDCPKTAQSRVRLIQRTNGYVESYIEKDGKRWAAEWRQAGIITE